MIKPELIFHDTMPEYCFPAEPLQEAEVTILLRVATDSVSAVSLCLAQEIVEMKRIESGNLAEANRYTESNHDTEASCCREADLGFAYYSATIKTGKSPFRYYFQIVFSDGTGTCYDRAGLYPVEIADRQGTHFLIVPGFSTPDWAKGAVFYQIFPDRFCKGNLFSDVLTDEYTYVGEHVRSADSWEELPPVDGDYRTFYGGDLLGIIEKLDYLKDLGIDAIYLNPIFVSPSSHKYDTMDYNHVDPHLGRLVRDEGALLQADREAAGHDYDDNTKATRFICRMTDRDNLEASDRVFEMLIKSAHAKGLRVILDGVFNHCGSFHKWLDREKIYATATGEEQGAFLSEESPFKEYFQFHSDCWPCNGDYDAWWGFDTLPKLNYEASEKLQNYIIAIGRKWVSPPYNADGWRLDVAADLGHSKVFNIDFWKRFRAAVKDANPSAVILAEHYGEAGDWLTQTTWDSVMNYDSFMDPVSFFITGMEKHSDEYKPELVGDPAPFWEAMCHMTTANLPVQSQLMAMNELSNHDHSRFLTRTNHVAGRVEDLGHEKASQGLNPGEYAQAALIQFTWPGAPTIYYGDEAGVCGFTDPDNRRTYPWGHEHKYFIDFHKELTTLRHECEELRTGALIPVTSEKGLIAYGRFNQTAAGIAIVNTNPYAVTREFNVRVLGVPENCIMHRCIQVDSERYNVDPVIRTVSDGLLILTIPPQSASYGRYVFR